MSDEKKAAVKVAEADTKASGDWFGRFAMGASSWLGSKWGWTFACLSIVLWWATGPHFHYSDSWQLVANTGTNLITFLMVFLIQNTQNRDARAINLKLNEVIFAISGARDQMIDIEKLSDKELDELSDRYERIRKECEARKSKGSA